MRYLISYDSPRLAGHRGERLRVELVDLLASPYHRWAWMLESNLTAKGLLQHLKQHVEEGDRLLVVEITDRDVEVSFATPYQQV